MTWRRWRHGKRSETSRTLTERHLGWQLAPDNPVVVAAGKKTNFSFCLKLFKFLSSQFIGISVSKWQFLPDMTSPNLLSIAFYSAKLSEITI